MKEVSKRETILDAALSVVAAKGYISTKVEDIARKAGVAKGTVYLYFKDKSDIYIGLVDSILSKGLELVREIDSRPLSQREKLSEVFAAWVRGMHEQPGMVPLVSMESINLAAREVDRFKQSIKPRIRELIEAIAAIVRPGIEAGEFRRVDPYMAALMFVHSFPMNIMVVRHKLPVQDPVGTTLDMFFHGILPGTEPKPNHNGNHRKPL